MGETAAALRLEAKSNFVVDANGDDGGGGVWRNNYFESIGECGRLDGYLHCGGSLNRAKAALILCNARITEASV